MEKVTFEQAMKRLNEIVGLMDKSDLPLESAIELFEEGLKLLSFCDQQLKGFEQKVEQLMDTFNKGRDNHDENPI